MGSKTGIALIALLCVASLAGFASAANVHLVSWRAEPEPRPHQDFDLLLSFKNDVETSVDNLSVYLDCPEGLACLNATATVAPYAIQEVRIPIKSDFAGGFAPITVSWEDESGYFVYNESSGISQSQRARYSTSVNLYIREHTVSNVVVSGNYSTGHKANFTLSFTGANLDNVEATLSSDCISFEKPLFHFDRVDGSVNISSPAAVNCRSGSRQVVFTLSSDEVSYALPLTLDVEKEAAAKIFVYPKSSEGLPAGKGYYSVSVLNRGGAVAEHVVVAVLSNSAINSPDAITLGDMAPGDERDAVFEVEAKKAGEYPLNIEARWLENGEQFTQTSEYEEKFTDPGLGIVPYAAAACLLVIVWLSHRRKQK